MILVSLLTMNVFICVKRVCVDCFSTCNTTHIKMSERPSPPNDETVSRGTSMELNLVVILDFRS